MKVRTSVLRGFALLALSSLTFAACDEKVETPVIPPTIAVTVTPQTVNLQVGQTTTLVATVSGTANQQVTWQSANTAVATVNANGQITAVAPGTAVVTATSAADPNARSAAAVIVTAPPPPPAPTIQLVPPTATAQVGQTVQLVAIVGNTTNQAVTYTSSDTAVATVSTTGLVTARRAGTAVITARTAATPQAAATSVITVTAAPPPTPITITIAPTQAAVTVGQTQQFTASVQGSTNTGVIYRSESPNVATINQTTGLATGVAAGTATITAMAAADTTRRVTATLTVTAAPPVTQPAISIASVTRVGTGQALTPGGAVGDESINVVVNVSAGSEARIGRVEIRLGEATACQQTFNPPLAATQGVQTISCVINTAALDANGAPLFLNGTYTLTARAFNEAGTQVATATWGALVVNNTNRLGLTGTSLTTVGVDGPGSAFVNGLEWREGNVVVTARPVIFTQGVQVQTVTLCVQAADGPVTAPACRQATSANGVFTATFPKATAPNDPDNPGVAGITTSALGAYGASIYNTNAAGPMVAFGAGPTIRLDNVAPVATAPNPAGLTLTPDPTTNWLNANYTFQAQFTGGPAVANAAITGVNDMPPGCEAAAPRLCVGVAGNGVTFHAVPSATYTAPTGTAAEQQAQLAAFAAANPGVTNVSSLPQTTSPSAYRLIIGVRDRLGNVTYYVGEQFGVDRTAPTAAIVMPSPVENHINPQINPSGGRVGGGAPVVFNFSIVDEFGDVPENPFWVRLIRHFGAGSPTCYDVNTKALVDPNFLPADAETVAGQCPWIRLNGNVFTMEDLPDGVWDVEVRARDRARNVSNVLTRRIIIDGTGPVLAQQPFSPNLTATDSVGLRNYDQRLRFAGVGALPIIAPVQIGTPQNRVMTHTFLLTTTPPQVWRGLQIGATFYPIDATGYAVRNLAWQQSEFFTPFDPIAAGLGANVGAYDALVADGNPAGNPAGSLATFTLSRSTGNNLSGMQARQVGNTDWGPDNTTTTIAGSIVLTATATGNTGTGFRRPFAAVHFYRIDDLTGHVFYLGQSTAPTVSFPSGGTQAAYAYAFTYSNSTDTNLRGGNQSFFAVGSDFDGDARRTDNTLTNLAFTAYQQGR